METYACVTTPKDTLTVYKSPDEGQRGTNTVSFVAESRLCRHEKCSAILSMDDVRRLRDQLTKLLGE